MRRLSYVVVFILWSCMLVQGQTDRIVLQNNSLVKGKIVSVTNDQVQLEIIDGQHLNLPFETIKWISHRTRLIDSSSDDFVALTRAGKAIKFSGGIGIFTDPTDEAGESAKLEASMLYRVLPNIEAGVSIGYMNTNAMTLFPIEGVVRANLFQAGNTPFLLGSIGHAFGEENNGTLYSKKGSLTTGLSVGYGWAINNIELFVAAGWRKTNFTEENRWIYYWYDISTPGGNYTKIERSMNMGELRLGIRF